MSVQQLSLRQFDSATSIVEDAVDRSPTLDPWCSGPDWVVAVHRAFAPESEPFVLRGDPGFAAFARYATADGERIVAGLEPLWGFASPLLGPDPAAVARMAVDWLELDSDWTALVVPGQPADRDSLLPVARELSRLGDVGLQEGITRRLVDLDGGVDGWLARRPAKFRRNLANARRRAAAAGVTFEIVDDAAGVFERILAVERTSWKGRELDGIVRPPMGSLYRDVIERLDRNGRRRCVIARMGGDDVGYILGGVRRDRYRGLQLSYRDDVGTLSLGHLLQAHEIGRMSAEGCAIYDMGMDMDYKQKMADSAMTTVMLVVRRSPRPA